MTPLGFCRRVPHEGKEAGVPATVIIWGKLFRPEALGPKCDNHAAVHRCDPARDDRNRPPDLVEDRRRVRWTIQRPGPGRELDRRGPLVSYHDVHPDYGRCPFCQRSFRKRADGRAEAALQAGGSQGWVTVPAHSVQPGRASGPGTSGS